MSEQRLARNLSLSQSRYWVGVESDFMAGTGLGTKPMRAGMRQGPEPESGQGQDWCLSLDLSLGASVRKVVSDPSLQNLMSHWWQNNFLRM